MNLAENQNFQEAGSADEGLNFSTTELLPISFFFYQSKDQNLCSSSRKVKGSEPPEKRLTRSPCLTTSLAQVGQARIAG